jgi:cell shape-determining protein MreC
MNDTGPQDFEGLIDEVCVLRAENQRLRSLLGLDQESR